MDENKQASTHFYMVIEGPPDSHGRRPFTLLWREPHGVFRPEKSRDGKPVGYRRGQCYRAVPADTISDLQRRGHTVSEVAADFHLPAE